MLTVLLAALITFLAAVSVALTGFGFALVLVPLLSLLYDPKLVVLVSLTLGLVSKPALLAQCWHYIQWRRITPMTAAAVAGSALGARLLLSASGPQLQLAIGLLVVVLGGTLLIRVSRPIKQEGPVALLMGLVSGVLTGSTSMGGPPVVLLAVNQRWEKAHFRANLVAFFAISSLSSLLWLWQAGALTADLLRLDAVLLPALALGLVAGTALFRAVPTERFRVLVVLLVIATGAIGAVGGANNLWSR